MLQERPDITRGLIQDLKSSSPVEGLTIYRRNGVEAFTDLATLREVSKEAELPKDVVASIEKMRREPGRTMTGPLFQRAVETLRTQEALETRDGVSLFVLQPAHRQPGAVPGMPRHRPQGARGGARGDVDGAGAGPGRDAAQSPDHDRDPHHRDGGGRARGGHALRGGAAHSRADAGRPADRRGRLRGPRPRLRRRGGRARHRAQRHDRAPVPGAAGPGSAEHRAGHRAREPAGLAPAAGAAGAAQGRAQQVRARRRQGAPRARSQRDDAREAQRGGLRALSRHRRLHAPERAARGQAAEPARADLLQQLPRDHPRPPRRRERDGGRRAHGHLPAVQPRGAGPARRGPRAQCHARGLRHPGRGPSS